MGAVFRPKDLKTGFRTIIESSLKDLHPDTRNEVFRLLNTWGSTGSEEKLIELLGASRWEELLKIVRKNSIALDEDETEDLQKIFKESLTFD